MGDEYDSPEQAVLAARKMAPGYSILLESYWPYKSRFPSLDFLEKYTWESGPDKPSTVSFKVNPGNPSQTNLSNRSRGFLDFASFVGVLLLYAVPLLFGGFSILHFGQRKALALILMTIAVCMDILLAFMWIQFSKPEFYRLEKKPKFSVVLGPDFSYDQFKHKVLEK